MSKKKTSTKPSVVKQSTSNIAPLEPEILENILDEVGVDKEHKTLFMVRVQALQHHSGPLPQAEQFAIYEDV